MRRSTIAALVVGTLVGAPTAFAGGTDPSTGASVVRSLLAQTTPTVTTTTPTATTQDGQQPSDTSSAGAQIAAGFTTLGQLATALQNAVQGAQATQTPPTQGTAGATSEQTASVAASDPLGGSDQSASGSTQGGGGGNDQGGGGGGNNQGGGGNDPCSGKNPPPICSQAPETPFPLLYPAAAVAALAAYLLIERRRRRTGTLAG